MKVYESKPPLLSIGLRKSISKFLNDMIIDEELIKLPNSVEYDIGTYICNQSVDWSYPDTFTIDPKFTPEEREYRDNIPLLIEPYVVGMDNVGFGVIFMKGIKILSEPYKNVLLLYIHSNGEVVGGYDYEIGDNSVLHIEGSEKTLNGYLEDNSNDVENIKLFIHSMISEYTTVPLGEGKSFQFSHTLIPDEDMLIVTYDNFSPNDLKKILNIQYYLFGHIKLNLQVKKEIYNGNEDEIIEVPLPEESIIL